MTQIIAERQSAAALQLNPASNSLRTASVFNPPSAAPSFINPINGLPAGLTAVNDVSALDELIQRKLRQHNQHVDSSLLLRQGFHNELPSLPSHLDISRMGPSAESIRNMLMPLLHNNSFSAQNRPGNFPSSHLMQGLPPVANTPQDMVSQLVQANLNNLDQHSRGSAKDESAQDPSPRK
ncbi:hypothetical protein FisN_13Hu248 [Fistulifera solaris]|uniref:Uncharacterized protein n=1 Tax=Fistulifera solaris TaxID=1519565 RepID=A0A1Z5KN02_FISSO|nr:hypothetical protein FisN_13Hu248 [Fistulifera solaris]|eukprot:GAX27659.1 hypothetical protein FisN_13Hu248 [Fistulifera solaris]